VEGKKERSRGQIVERSVTTRANVREVCCEGRGYLQDPDARMTNDPTRCLKSPPAHRDDTMPLPTIPQSGVLEEHEEIVGNDANPEEGGVGAFLATGLAACKAYAPCQSRFSVPYMDAVLGVLAPLAVPDQHIGSASGPVAGDEVIARMVFFQQSA